MITSIQFQGYRRSPIRVDVALPVKDRGAITVLCGRNHSGKSYILKHIQRTITGRNTELNKTSSGIAKWNIDEIYCDFLPDNEPLSSVSISNILNVARLTKGISTVQESNHKSRRYIADKAENYDQIQIKESLEVFGAECLKEYHEKHQLPFSLDNWTDPKRVEYRTDILLKLASNNIFEASRRNEVVQIFERLTNGKVYFGVSIPKGNLPLIVWYLAFSGDIIIPIGSWSQGQQVLFALLMLLHYKKPQVLLFDEIENHLHPEYISVVLDIIKNRVPQTIIATHHPHIIFSRHVDLVYFLELEKPPSELADILDYDRKRAKSPVRKVQALEKTYAKLISTYKLFDSYDNLLLRLSSSNLENLNEVLVNTFTQLFFYEVVPPDRARHPDLQSQKLYELFTSKMASKNIKVLEIGAGNGRLLIDVNKLLNVSEKEKIKWVLYEPNNEHRNQLQKEMENFTYKNLVTVSEVLPDDKFDFIVIANVLHEQTPSNIAAILSYCQGALEGNGKALIIELFPLLSPEKYAVPLRSQEWVALSRKLGFNAIDDGIYIKNATVEAYLVQLTNKKGKALDRKQMEALIKRFWNTEILKQRTGNYSGQINLDNSEQIPKAIGNLTTIASIIANKYSYWE